MTEQPEQRIGAMRGTARLLSKHEQPKPALRLVKDDESDEVDRPERVEKEDDNGR